MNHDAGKTPQRCDLHILKNIFIPQLSSQGAGLYFCPVMVRFPIYVLCCEAGRLGGFPQNIYLSSETISVDESLLMTIIAEIGAVVQ